MTKDKNSVFVDDISKLADYNQDLVETALQAIALEAFSRVIKKTPVDSGRARGNWTCTINKPATGICKDEYKDSSLVIAKVITKVEQFELGNSLYLSNNLPYIQKLELGGYPKNPKNGTYLKKGKTKGGYTGPGYFEFSEDGYSKQAPEGMVRTTMLEMDEIVKKAFED